MNWEGWITIGGLFCCLVGMFRRVLPAEVMFLGLLALLLASGVLTTEEALAGFANPGIVSIASLFVIAGALQHTGALAFVANRIFGRTQTGPRALLKMMLCAAGPSAFLNSTPIVAMFVPVVNDWARRNGVSPSRYLIPLSFATILGGTCTLIGTSTNLVGNSLMVGAGMHSLSFFELAAVGLPCAIVGLLFIATVGWYLLPDHKGLTEQIEGNSREYIVELKVLSDCPLLGKTIAQAGLRGLPGLFLIDIERGQQRVGPVGPQERIVVGDIMVFTGIVSTIVDLHKIRGLAPAQEYREGRQRLWEHGNLSEAVVSSESPLVGSTIRGANFRTQYGAAVVAVHRGANRIVGKIGDIVLHAGDTLLLETSPGFARAYRNSPHFYLVSEVGDSHVPRYEKAIPALFVLLALVSSVTFGVIPIVTAALLGAITLVVLGCIPLVQARGAVDMSVLITIAAAFGIGRALEKTGTAALIASTLLEIAVSLGPVGLLAAVYLVTSFFSEMISNVAAVALVFPISHEVAFQFGVDPRPFAIAVTVAASSSFVLPLGYQTNLMVYGAGGYSFSDFVKIGLPLKSILFLVSMLCIPHVWPL